MQNGKTIYSPLLLFSNLYITAPLIIALLFMLLTKDLKRWLCDIKPKRVYNTWTLFIIVGCGITGTSIYGFVVKDFSFIKSFYPSISSFLGIALYLMLTSLLEEVVWRGYVFNHISDKHSVLSSSIITGLIWGIFHVPMWWIRNGSTWGIILLSFIMVINVSIILGFIYNKNKNMVSAFIGHLLLNIFFLWDGKTILLYVVNIFLMVICTGIILYKVNNKSTV